MASDVEKVARLLAESDGHAWLSWFAEEYGDDYRKKARAAMAATREIDAAALRELYRASNGQPSATGLHHAADWLTQRAQEMKQ